MRYLPPRIPHDEAIARGRRFLATMDSRRSVRDFSPKPVPRDIIELAVGTANTAPSGAHQQPWTFVCISEPALKSRIRAAAEEEEKAFDGSRASEAWIDALDALKAALVACKAVTWHFHVRGTQQCPWCAIEQPTRTKLFGGLVKVATAAIADPETLWARYLALAEPGPPRPLPRR